MERWSAERRRAGGARRVALLALAAWPLAAQGYRPFDSTDAAVAAKGELELEAGAGDLAEGGDRSLVAPSLVLNWGFAERWEAVLEARHLVHLGGSASEPPQPRVEDAAVSVKRVVRAGSLQERAGPSLAVELSALLPAIPHDEGLGASGALVASWRGRALTVHLNALAAWTRAHAPGAFAGAIGEGPDRWPVRPVAEAFLEWERDAPATRSALAGAIWRASEALSVDAAVRRARAGAVSTTELRVGLTWAFRVR